MVEVCSMNMEIKLKNRLTEGEMHSIFHLKGDLAKRGIVRKLQNLILRTKKGVIPKIIITVLMRNKIS